jgi:hypothetical protein
LKVCAVLSGIGLVAVASLALGCSPRASSGKAPATPAPARAPLVKVADETEVTSSSSPSPSDDDGIPSTREADDTIALDEVPVGTTTLTSMHLPIARKLLLPVELWEHWDEPPLPPRQTWGVSPSDEERAELWGY